MLTSPSGKSYIGQTIERKLENRLKKHRLCYSGCRALINAVEKYGWDKIQLDWYECPDEDLDFDETLLIEEMGTLAPNGYNLKEGGNSNSPSQETREKIRNTLKGQIITETTKQKMSDTRTGRKYSWGHKISGAKKKISDKQIISGIRYGKTQAQIAREFGLTPAAISYRVKKMNAP